MSVTLNQTFPQVLAYGVTKLGIPYSEVLDGGTGPDYFDCSGLMQNIFHEAGDPGFLRDTYQQWGDQRYAHLGPYGYGQAPAAQAGWIAYMHVDGEADPGHVGLAIGNGTYLNAPHTGAVVRIESISNTSSEHVYGYLIPQYAASVPVPPAPAPAPSPIPMEKEMLTHDKKSNGYWGARSNGDVYTFDGAPYIGPLAKYLTQWGIGTAANPVVGIAADDVGGFSLLADSGGPQPLIYNIPADGRYAS